MKRRRLLDSSSLSTKSTQLKISKFFSGTFSSQVKNNQPYDDLPQSSASSNLSKTLQVAVPYSINLLNEDPIAIDDFPTSSSKKLQQFLSTEDYQDITSEATPRECSSSCGALPIPIPSKSVEMYSEAGRNTLLTAKENHLKLTPLEQQVVDMKVANPELLLIIECGYKYRIFGEDAEAAGQLLNMTVYPNHNFLSISFPIHRLLIHVKKLVSHGYKVGVVKQKETAALKVVSSGKNAPFKRDICAVYTKATFIDEADNSGITSFLNIPLCITFICESYTKSDGTVQIGIISCFTEDGEVVYDHFEDSSSRSGLDTRLTHWQPSEIVLPDKGISAATQNFAKQFSSYKTTSGDCIRIEYAPLIDWACSLTLLLQIYYGDENMTATLQQLPPVIVSCLYMAHHHFKQFKMEQLIANLSKLREYSSANEFLQMDGNTVRNLNLVPLFDNDHYDKGTLFSILYQTRTQFGARLLRSWILKPLISRDTITARHKAIDWFLKHQADVELMSLKKSLKLLPNLDKRLTAILHGRCRPREFHGLCCSWLQFRQSVIQFKSFYEDLPSSISSSLDSAIDSLTCVPSYLQQINESAVKSGDKTQIFADLTNYPNLLQMVDQIQHIENQLQDLKPSICKQLGLIALNYVTVSGNEYLIEVKNAMLHSVPASWIKISATKQCGRFRSPEVNLLVNELSRSRELLKAAADEAWLLLLRRVSVSYLTLKKANTAIATIDVLLAFADVAKSENYSKPIIVEETGVLNIKHGRHPVVSHFIRNLSGEYVPNDTYLNTDKERCMILTGPNMGGKSCYLSQVAAIVILAQIGSYVPAAEATLSIFRSIFIRMGLYDEIYAGRSTFFVEMMETSSILSNASSESLVIIDELGQGTGTHDGSAIAFAVLEYLVTKLKCATLFVTHYPIVAQLEETLGDHIVNYHMGYLLDSEGTGKTEEDSLVFLYQLKRGKCPKSFGLNVARLAGIPGMIINQAKIKSMQYFSEGKSFKTDVSEF